MRTAKTLLCIDDDAMLLDIVQQFFQTKGHTVVIAENGKIGLEMFCQYRPDLVLVDLRMPIIDGFQVLKEVVAASPYTPIIVISGEGEMADVIKALHLGAWHYMTKPVDNYDLLEHAVNQALEKAELILENNAYQEGLEKKLSNIVEHFPGFVFTCDAAFKISYANKAFVDHFGDIREEETCYETLFGTSIPDMSLAQFIGCEKELFQHEVLSPKDMRWYQVTVLPVLDQNNTIAEYQVVLRDITEQKQRIHDAEEREAQLREENTLLLSSLDDRFRFGNIVGKSKIMQEVYRAILDAARSDASVVIYGESGTGKELVAQAIHQNSKRKNAPYISVNCSAIPENLIESEFFGYKKGAFSGAIKDKYGFLDIADGGTLFLDEVGDIPLQLQVKLLRALEGGGFTPLGGTLVKKPDLRILSATNRDLTSLVQTGLMRQDFLYRIHVIPIRLPPLRQRKEDIELLIDDFLDKYDAEGACVLPIHIRKILLDHSWPGNVRELQNAIQRYVATKTLDFFTISTQDGYQKDLLDSIELSGQSASLTVLIETLEKELIARTFKRNDWHRGKTAEALGVDRKTLYRKMKAHNILRS